MGPTAKRARKRRPEDPLPEILRVGRCDRIQQKHGNQHRGGGVLASHLGAEFVGHDAGAHAGGVLLLAHARVMVASMKETLKIQKVTSHCKAQDGQQQSSPIELHLSEFGQPALPSCP